MLPRQTAEHDRGEPPAVRSYLGYLSDRSDAVVAALRALAAPVPGASVVHCAAGKAEYAAGQRAFAERGAVLRRRLLGVCDHIVVLPGDTAARSRSPLS